MATTTSPTTAADTAKSPSAGDRAAKSGAGATTTVSSGTTGVDQPAAERGKTSIADGVVEKIAGMATREVSGVHALGANLARTLGAVRDRVPGGRGTGSVSRGVKAEVGQKQTAIDLDVVIEYGVPIHEVSEDIRENVISALERMTGLEVVEVNITVHDIHLPEDDDEEEPETARVQ
ncbi:Asp23/Gls24 family envelope stress response protein [Streptomyces bohaiensis]|uniref:Asp23/Gls24 family envelope stress response protein n=1 Tax=Streptomyces bohaiensis TaxID=1431344 RepID=UPI003B8012ED